MSRPTTSRLLDYPWDMLFPQMATAVRREASRIKAEPQILPPLPLKGGPPIRIAPSARRKPKW